MCDRQHRESHAPLPDCTASAHRQTDVVEPEMQYEEPCQEREEDWRRSLHSLSARLCVFQFENVLPLGPVICAANSMRVAAERARNRFRHCHRPKWGCYSGSTNFYRQPKHWIEAKRSYRHDGSISSRRFAHRELCCSRRERRLPNAGSRWSCAHLGVRSHD